MNKNFLCAVLCFNNEKIIQNLIDDLIKSEKLNKIEKIFIDDHSSDKTISILKKNNLTIIEHNKNLGYGGAVKSAFEFAKKKNFEYFCIFPGDYQRAIDDVLFMIDLAENNDYDLISGSKFKKIELLPYHRKIGNLFYSKMAKVFWGSKIQDVLSGFKTYKVKKFDDLIENLPNNYSFDIVMNQIITKRKFLCKEFEADVKYNEHTSKMKSMFYFGKKNILYVGINMFFSTIFEIIKFNLFKK